MGLFYPPNLASDQQLPFYTQHFATVEVNFSFYRLPERSVWKIGDRKHLKKLACSQL